MHQQGSFHTRENNFDFLRFFAASLVVVSHCYYLLGREAEEPFLLATGYYDAGAMAVGMFFVISGYLITGSYFNSRTLGSFLLKRALRIFPALAVAVLVTTFLIGPLVTSLSLGAYLGDGGTWLYLRNILLLTNFALPGVYLDNPFAGVVNGSLWTLPLEVMMYMGVVILGTLGLLKRRLIFLPLAVLGVGQLWLLYGAGVQSFFINKVFQLGLLYYGGAALYLYRDEVPWRGWIAVLLGALTVATFDTPVGMLVFFAAVPYIVLYLAYLPVPKLSGFGKYGDFSYGIYIFSFPLQQMNVQLFGADLGLLSLFVLTYVPTLLLAALSWHYIEAPALQLKSLFGKTAETVRAAPEPVLEEAVLSAEPLAPKND